MGLNIPYNMLVFTWEKGKVMVNFCKVSIKTCDGYFSVIVTSLEPLKVAIHSGYYNMELKNEVNIFLRTTEVAYKYCISVCQQILKAKQVNCYLRFKNTLVLLCQ